MSILCCELIFCDGFVKRVIHTFVNDKDVLMRIICILWRLLYGFRIGSLVNLAACNMSKIQETIGIS